MSNFLDEIRQEWRQYQWQLIGAGLLLLALISGWLSARNHLFVWLGFGFLNAVGIIDIWLCLPEKIKKLLPEKLIPPPSKSISKWIQKQFKWQLDLILLSTSLVITTMVFWGQPAINQQVILFSLIYAIGGHLFWHGD